ncbi:hypothetical protein V8E51_000218 [Hyaloscypha variabilis]
MDREVYILTATNILVLKLHLEMTAIFGSWWGWVPPTRQPDHWLQHDTVLIGSSSRALLCIALNLFLFFYAWLPYHVGASALLAGELAALPTQIGIKMVCSVPMPNEPSSSGDDDDSSDGDPDFSSDNGDSSEAEQGCFEHEQAEPMVRPGTSSACWHTRKRASLGSGSSKSSPAANSRADERETPLSLCDFYSQPAHPTPQVALPLELERLWKFYIWEYIKFAESPISFAANSCHSRTRFMSEPSTAVVIGHNEVGHPSPQHDQEREFTHAINIPMPIEQITPQRPRINIQSDLYSCVTHVSAVIAIPSYNSSR